MGYLIPTNGRHGENDVSVGNLAWNLPDEARTLDEVFAFSILPTGEESNYLKIGSFGFNIPLNAIIRGIEFNGFCYGTNTSITDMNVRLFIDGVGTGANRGLAGDEWPLDVIGWKKWGHFTDDWNLNLTPAIINDPSFSIAISAINVGPSTGTIYVDYVSATCNFISPATESNTDYYY